MQSQHATRYKEYLEYKDISNNKRKAETGGSSSESVASKKTHVQTQLTKTVSVTQNQVDQLIVKYIVDCMCPISTVEKDSFISLVTGLAPSKTVMDRKTASNRIVTAHAKMIAALKKKLQAVDHVCTTADIWSTNRRSYMGMTIHWIGEDLVRQSAAIACRRLKGSHTFDAIGKIISEVHDEFDLEISKIVSTVTDNASNFKKAFAEYMKIDSDDVDDNDDDDNQLRLTDVGIILDTQIDCDTADAESIANVIQLPRHILCACHSLNLVATRDVDPTKICNVQYSRMCHATFGKCQAIWNAVSRSSKAADAVSEICSGESLLIPCTTRWNSMYDAISRLIKLNDKLPQICETLQLPKLSKAELDFMREYTKVMEPLASCLDVLQGDKDCYFGMLLPKLIHLCHNLRKMACDNFQYCGPLLNAMQAGIGNRFKNLLDMDLNDTADPTVREAVLAAICLPQYKLKWVPPARREEFSQHFVETVVRANAVSVNAPIASVYTEQTTPPSAGCE